MPLLYLCGARILTRTTRRQMERGEQKKAIGRSRGRRNTKIHAIADAKGRLLSIPLTGGQAHAVRPVASHTRTPLGTGIIDVAPR
jgi:hypothetical protein